MFKDVEGYPGYKVNENGIVINKKGHVMRPGMSNVGRLRVALEVYDDNGKLLHRDNKSTYRLVAQAFIPNPDNLPCVNHKDEEGRKISPWTDVHTYSIFEVRNDDRSKVYTCKGRSEVAVLIGYEERSVRPGKILTGAFKGYTVENVWKQYSCPISFINE